MKKLSLATLVALAFVTSACGGGNPSYQGNSNERGSDPDPTPTVTVTVTPGPNPTPTVTVLPTPRPFPTITGTPVRPDPILPPILPIAYPDVGGGTTQIDDPTGASTITQNLGAQGAASCSTVQECAQNSAAVAQAAGAFVGLETQAEGTISDSVGGGTKDVDQQSAQADQADQENRAQGISNSFGMDYSKALELTRLADQVQSLSKSNQMTTEDQDAITQKALSVAGISSDDVNGAVAQVVKTGDQTAIDGLMTKAATNLGMPSSAGLREQILPALGIRF